MIDQPRRRHGDPLAHVILLDGLEEDREALRQATDEGMMCHPFTTARFHGLGWAVRPKDARVGDWLGGMPLRWELTPKGEEALAIARKRWHRIRPKSWWER